MLGQNVSYRLPKKELCILFVILFSSSIFSVGVMDRLERLRVKYQRTFVLILFVDGVMVTTLIHVTHPPVILKPFLIYRI